MNANDDSNDAKSSDSNLTRRGIYLLPNLLTTAGLFAGFYAVVAAMNGLFDLAAIAIFVAMVMDALDGRVARLTNTASAFGREYDSLSDMVAFGIAPALVVFSWNLRGLGKIGWLIAFIYAAATALRLARFNTQSEAKSSKRYFNGLACTPTAGVIAGLVWLGDEYHLSGYMIAATTAILTLSLAGLMVSNIRYYSFKEIDLKGKIPFVGILLIVLVFVCISIAPPQVLFTTFFVYALSGPIMWLLQRVRGA